MRKVLFVSALMLSSVLSFGQTTTLVFKPNATVGKDTPIWKFDDDCIGNGSTQTNADRNFGTEETLWMKDWTWNAIGCSGGTIRSLLCFTELSNIPSNAVIVSATLRLYGVTSDRNTSYSGAPASYYENTVVVQQITSPWNENTVTWNTQPSTTTANQFIIPQSTSEYNWNYSNSSPELVAMVQNMVSGNNYGFMLRLQTEQHYRNMVFASSDHPDASLHPELEVTYRVCNAHFSYCVANTGDKKLKYTFHSLEQGGQHTWKLGLSQISTRPDFEYSFSRQLFNKRLCHRVIKDSDTCEYCMDLCLPDYSEVAAFEGEEELSKETPKANIEHGKVHLGDEIGEEVDNMAVKIVPNPSKGIWNVSFLSSADEEVEVILYDTEGKLLQRRKEKIKAGTNELKVDCPHCAGALYILSVRGREVSFERTLVKE